MKRRGGQLNIRGQWAESWRRLCVVPFLTLLPLLLLLSLLAAEGWKALIGLCLGSAVIVVIALLARHRLHTDAQPVGGEQKIKDRLLMK